MATKASGAEQVLEKGSALTAGEIPDDADKRAKDHNPLAPAVNVEPGR